MTNKDYWVFVVLIAMASFCLGNACQIAIREQMEKAGNCSCRSCVEMRKEVTRMYKP